MAQGWRAGIRQGWRVRWTLREIGLTGVFFSRSDLGCGVVRTAPRLAEAVPAEEPVNRMVRQPGLRRDGPVQDRPIGTWASSGAWVGNPRVFAPVATHQAAGECRDCPDDEVVASLDPDDGRVTGIASGLFLLRLRRCWEHNDHGGERTGA